MPRNQQVTEWEIVRIMPATSSHACHLSPLIWLPWWLRWWRIHLQCRRPGFDPWLGRHPGEENSYPLQYSGLENSTDCIVHGVEKSRTRLSNFHSISLHVNSLLFLLLSPIPWYGYTRVFFHLSLDSCSEFSYTTKKAAVDIIKTNK